MIIPQGSSGGEGIQTFDRFCGKALNDRVAAEQPAASVPITSKINVTNFSSISYYSNVRLISKIELEQNVHSIIIDIHASANKRPPHLFHFKLRSTNKYKIKMC